ncbi:MAG: tRNA (adenosine(37)-N6)-threonylcarbamoyltransferase complex ATPase subunit type 1 TsaE [Bacteroidetes bacterium]|nr:tRNA (adenosine(37)-N6)-threonylcarbamoyltransferase complex ATPase subunit type 1 TsaE [Bacteroidota bacterium]
MASLKINNLAELPLVAKALIEAFGTKKVIAFNGEMGAGKTTLIKTICEQLGVKQTISSPTFSIVNEYLSSSGKKIYHFDFYRINTINEAYDMGYEEYFYSEAYCFIEWPEKIAELLPEDVLRVNISVKDGVRLVEF